MSIVLISLLALARSCMMRDFARLSLAFFAIVALHGLLAPSLHAQAASYQITPLVAPLVHPAAIHGVALSPDGRWAATGCSDHFLRIWEVTTGKLHGDPLAHEGEVYPVVFSPDSRIVVAGSVKGAKLWEVATGTELATLPHPGFVYALAFRPDGKAVLTSNGSPQ